MGRRLSSTRIGSYSEYRLRLGRLADLWGHDPMLDTTEAEDLLDAVAAYMVDGGDLVGADAEPEPAEGPARAYTRQEH